MFGAKTHIETGMLARSRSATALVIGALLLLSAPPANAAGDDFKRVAYDDAGNATLQPHLTESDGNWHCPNPGTDNEALRTCAFGPRVAFAYAGLNPKAQYKAKLRFFSDGAREVCVKAGETVLLPSAKLETGKPVEREVNLPVTAATLIVSVECLSGPNAIISDIEILSTDPTLLTAPPPPPLILPTITRRPINLAGSIDLCGSWKFNPAPPADFPSTTSNQQPATSPGWHSLPVPGEWVMQGFTVKPGEAAGYFRTFALPIKPAGQRVKLRFDAVYSLCRVFVNGVAVGEHEGGFVPFEFDITDAVKAGANTLALTVQSESVSDNLSCGSQYACHPLGGITRKVGLFTVPEIHISDLKIDTRFDSQFLNATLTAHCVVRNQSSKAVSGFKLTGSVAGATGEVGVPAIAASETAIVELRIPVSKPAQWDCEHPNLHTLKLELSSRDDLVETLAETVGFRQIEVKGTQVLVNGRPIKLHGVCRHEAHPLLGRALGKEQWEADARLFRDMNCNFIRTSHYPPAPEFIEECDRLGLFVELEAPLCWVGHGASNHYKGAPTGKSVLDRLIQANLESVQGYPNHPSVIIRSLANESSWSPLFAKVAMLVKQADPTRPTTFHDQCWGGYNNSGSASMPIGNYHYPGFNGPAMATKSSRPIQFGENCHLNAYNRLELATDPALRDTWGRYTREMWDAIYSTTAVLGQSIWSGIDDTFFLPNGDTVGYGTWGPIDGWRREKPEYWGAKKAYSPVRILNGGQMAFTNNTLTVNVENRKLFSNMSEMQISWKLGSQSGVATADVKPGDKGVLPITISGAPQPGERLELIFTDPRGFVADQFSLALGDAVAPIAPPATGKTGWKLDDRTGLLTSLNGQPLNGPHLMLLPLNNAGETQMTGKTKVWTPFTSPCGGWTCTKVTKAGDTVTVEGQYDNAKGSYIYTFKPGGAVEIAYDFTVTKAVNPRQTGLVFTLPHACETLSWERKGYWDVYPADHIARLKGTVKASEGFEATSVGPRTKPSHPWRLDNLPYGNNDFCSTKHNIITATVADAAGRGITVAGRGEQHIRCWRTAEAVNVLVADYSNGGSERFLRGLAGKDDRPLKVGDIVKGIVTMIVR